MTSGVESMEAIGEDDKVGLVVNRRILNISARTQIDFRLIDRHLFYDR